jgi:threonine dehydrogenase-like Zn-dependent dehydrogenase
VKALVYRGPWDLRAEEVEAPTLDSGQVLLKIAATGICGSDVHGFAGRTGRRHPGQVMGHETAAWVQALGPDVAPDGLAVGQLVTVNPVLPCGGCERCRTGASYMCANRTVIGVSPALSSAFAEFMAVPVANVVPLSSGVTPQLGALVEPLAVGYHAAVRGGCGEGNLVLVVGGGPIGQACAIAARRLGAEVVVTELNADRRTLVASLGFDAVFDPAEEQAALSERLGEGAQVVIDAVGSSESLRAACLQSLPQARIVLVGMHSPALEVDAYRISTEEREVIGSFSYTEEEFAATAQWVSDHPELSRLVEAEVGWDGAPDAFTRLAKGESGASKILVVPGKGVA